MGKSRPERRNKKIIESSPTGLPSVKDFENEVANGCDFEELDLLIEKLTSLCPEEREYGCAALGIYFSQPTKLQEIFSKNVVRIVGPLLMDAKHTVRIAASRLLRSLSEEGGFEACEKMIQQDALTSIAAYMNTQISSWKQADMVLKNDTGASSVVDCVYTIQNLCECSTLAVRLCIEDGLPSLLLQCLTPAHHIAALQLACAQCLYTMSEENESLSEQLNRPECQRLLLDILSSSNFTDYVKVVVGGILLNAAGAGVAKTVIPAFISPLRQDAYSCLTKVMYSLLENETSEIPDSVEMVHEDEKDSGSKLKSQSLEKDIEALEHLLSAQKLSYEIITNLLADDDSDENWADMEDDVSDDLDDCDEVGDNDDGTDMDTVDASSGNQLLPTILEGDFLKYLIAVKFIDSRLCDAVQHSDKTHRSKLLSLLERYNWKIESALICVSNLLSQTPNSLMTERHDLRDFISYLITQLSHLTVTSQENLLGATTGVIRTALERMSQDDSVAGTQLLSDDNLNVLQGLSDSKHESIAVNSLRCLGIVGTVLSKNPEPSTVIKSIGQILVSKVSNEHQIWTIVESIDAIMDVFAEDSNNVHLTDLGIIDKLQAALPHLKKMAKREGKSENFLPVLSTVKTNLPRFIKYKKKLLK